MIKQMLTASGSASQTAFDNYQLAVAKQLPDPLVPQQRVPDLGDIPQARRGDGAGLDRPHLPVDLVREVLST